MALLYNREFSLTVGEVQIASKSGPRVNPTLGVAFKVEKNSQKEPNPAEVAIWNLSQATRVAVEAASSTVTLDVGYAGNTFRLFSGDLIYASTQRQGNEWVTRLQIQDGSAAFRSARVNESLGPGTTLADAIKRAATAMGLPLGNLESHLTNIRSGWQVFGRGVVLSGKAEAQLDKLLKAAGYDWSIQDGQLQVLAPGESKSDPVVVLNSASGLIGSPEKASKDDQKGWVKARSLLQPGLTPGRRVRIEGEAISGDFKVLRTVYTGDTWGAEWYADIEGRPI